MKKLVFDSWPILVYLHKEKAHARVKKLLEDAVDDDQFKLFMSVVNLAEIYYKELRLLESKKEAQKTIAAIEDLPIEIVGASTDIVMSAAEIKAEHPISLADCFAVAVALEKNATILTGDPEFKKVEKIVKVEWLK